MRHYRFAMLFSTFILTGALFCGAEEGIATDSPSKPVTMLDTRLSREKAPEVLPCWLVYASVRRAYQKEGFFRDNPGAREYRYTFKEELEARKMLSDAWANVKKQDPAVNDAYLNALVAVKEAGFLPEYVWYFLWDRGWGHAGGPVRLKAFDEWRALRLEDHTAETLAYPGKPTGHEQKEGEAVSPAIVPVHPPARDATARDYFEKGMERQRNRDHAGAIDAYLRAVRRDPAYTDAMDNLGLNYRAAGNYEEAEKWLRKSLSLQPKNGVALANLAIVYRLRGIPGREREVYQRMIEIDPENPEGYYGLGGVLHVMGRYDDSIRSMNTAISMFTRQNSPYLNHAYATQGFNYLMLKNRQKAIEYLEQARKGLPDDPRIKNGLEFARKQPEKKPKP
jgi:tetratricopeptide (TPR) repeat protein